MVTLVQATHRREEAMRAIQRGGSTKAANGHEADYGAAYQTLVAFGVEPQIRRKYRVGRGMKVVR